MKKIIQSVSFVVAFALGASYLIQGNAQAQSISQCSYSGGNISTPVANGACYAPASTMYYPVTKIMLCHQRLAAPTASTPINTSGCVLFYSSPSSQEVPAKLGAVRFPGIMASASSLLQSNHPNKGNQFSYAYIESLPYVSVQAQAGFTSPQTAVDGSTGSTCWSKSGQLYVYETSVPTTISSCGSSASANSAPTKVWLNSLGAGAAYMSYSDVENGQTVDTYLVDSGNKLAGATTAGSMGAVAKMINVQQMSYNFNMQSSGVNANVNISQAAWVNVSPVYFINGNGTLSLRPRN